MRGEDFAGPDPKSTETGSPPHARGRPKRLTRQTSTDGITPACAGKTSLRLLRTILLRDHPRMRGEDDRRRARRRRDLGSPPHARGRRGEPGEIEASVRITPACAGKTSACSRCQPWRRDHPRMRGEDLVMLFRMILTPGSPPHARGRQRSSRSRQGTGRITPACAGKTTRNAW